MDTTTLTSRRLRWLRVFEPLMVITGIMTPLATLPSITKLYFTHSQHASGQSLTTWSIFAIASLLWVTYGLLNRMPEIYAGNIIGLVMNLLMVNGILITAGWTY
jgi:MtN3 and saliva related transmembrane protein